MHFKSQGKYEKTIARRIETSSGIQLPVHQGEWVEESMEALRPICDPQLLPPSSTSRQAECPELSQECSYFLCPAVDSEMQQMPTGNQIKPSRWDGVWYLNSGVGCGGLLLF